MEGGFGLLEQSQVHLQLRHPQQRIQAARHFLSQLECFLCPNQRRFIIAEIQSLDLGITHQHQTFHQAIPNLTADFKTFRLVLAQEPVIIPLALVMIP